MVHVLDLGGGNKEKLAKELEEKEQNKDGLIGLDSRCDDGK